MVVEVLTKAIIQDKETTYLLAGGKMKKVMKYSATSRFRNLTQNSPSEFRR